MSSGTVTSCCSYCTACDSATRYVTPWRRLQSGEESGGFQARNSDWLERWQFTVAVCLEAVITLMANLIRFVMGFWVSQRFGKQHEVFSAIQKLAVFFNPPRKSFQLHQTLFRYSIRNSGHSDTLFTISFVQLQLTVSVNIVIIIAPKFYLVRSFQLKYGGPITHMWVTCFARFCENSVQSCSSRRINSQSADRKRLEGSPVRLRSR